MAAYVDYAFYIGTFMGKAIAQADFPRLAMRATAVVDQVTFGRAAPIVTAATDTAMIDYIKMATCSVAEELQVLDKNESGGEIQSEKVGNYSVTYVQGASANRSNQAKLTSAAKLYLGLTGLMYQGVDEN